jgi:hypothetical protein
MAGSVRHHWTSLGLLRSPSENGHILFREQYLTLLMDTTQPGIMPSQGHQVGLYLTAHLDTIKSSKQTNCLSPLRPCLDHLTYHLTMVCHWIRNCMDERARCLLLEEVPSGWSVSNPTRGMDL